MSEACADAAEALPSIFPGSWINGDFYIWIGHPDDHRAWSQLADARRALDARACRACRRRRWRAAREEMLIAEGSDWFWWYGDDHSSDHDLEFDELFRRHVRNVYRALDKPIPEELFVTNITTAAAGGRDPAADRVHRAGRSTARSRATSSGSAPAASDDARQRRRDAPGRGARRRRRGSSSSGSTSSTCSSGSTAPRPMRELLVSGVELTRPVPEAGRAARSSCGATATVAASHAARSGRRTGTGTAASCAGHRPRRSDASRSSQIPFALPRRARPRTRWRSSWR